MNKGYRLARRCGEDFTSFYASPFDISARIYDISLRIEVYRHKRRGVGGRGSGDDKIKAHNDLVLQKARKREKGDSGSNRSGEQRNVMNQISGPLK
tara:strand:- start:3541 stop:3828 length:288 start_codon:yes stop_codon:yes gene_type:complete